MHDVSATEKEAAWAKLQGKKYIWPYSISMLKMKAHSRRNEDFEIYIFETEFDHARLLREFRQHPQKLADEVRDTGECLYSDYIKPGSRIIK